MNMVIPDVGKVLLLNYCFVSDGSDFEEFVLELFKNNYTPDDDSEYGSFDAATFTGYSPITIDRAEFTDPTIVAHVAQTDFAPPPSWTCTAGPSQVVYGWFLYGADSFTVVAAQRFDSPRTMDTGTTETLDPFRIKLKTL